jgi:hypothetical protein
VVKAIKTHFVTGNVFFENSAVHKTVRGKPQMSLWRMRFAFWVIKDTNTLSEYIIRIAFALQLFLQEPASMLFYISTACLVGCVF